MFVYDEDNIYSIGNFTNASELTVHLIDSDEYDGNRVVNFNNETANKIDQHGLYLRQYDLDGGGPRIEEWLYWGVSLGANGPPGNHDETRCDLAQIEWDHDRDAPDVANDRSGDAKEWNITHELGHGVSIPHHQPTDYSGDTDCAMRYVFDNWLLWMKSAGDNAAQWNAMPIGKDFCDAGDDCKAQIEVSD